MYPFIVTPFSFQIFILYDTINSIELQALIASYLHSHSLDDATKLKQNYRNMLPHYLVKVESCSTVNLIIHTFICLIKLTSV